MVAAIPQGVMGMTALIFDPGLHTRILLGQDAFITKDLVERPGHDYCGAAPPGRPFEQVDQAPHCWLTSWAGDNIGDSPVGLLFTCQILEPLGIELSGLHQESAGACVDRTIARPPQPLARRTISGNLHKIALLAPENIVL